MGPAFRRSNFLPAAVLFFLAPAVGELLSGSSPPVEFFQPVSLLLNCLLYGSGALLVRELLLRWNKGWPSLLALGAAYGIIEEGLMVKSFFNPTWVDLGPLGVYGRLGGVNWVWTLELIVYHTVFSIAIPILLANLLFPARRAERWLGPGGMLAFTLLLAADVLFGYLFFPYYPPVGLALAAVAAVIGLGFLAHRLPRPGFPLRPGRTGPALSFFLTAFGGTLAFFLVLWVLPGTGLPPVGTLLLLAGVVLLTAWRVWRLTGRGLPIDELHEWALASGTLMFLILIDPLTELDKNRTDNPAGMGLVAIGFALFLAVLLWRIRRRVGNPQTGERITWGK